jgi:putative flippase GtrA
VIRLGGTPVRGRTNGSFVRYAMIGASGVMADYGLFLVLFDILGIHQQVASALSTTAGIANNFALNAMLNFHKRDRMVVRFARFYLVGLGGLALTFVLLHVFSGLLGFDPNLVKAGSLPLVVLFQFSINRKWSFA